MAAVVMMAMVGVVVAGVAAVLVLVLGAATATAVGVVVVVGVVWAVVVVEVGAAAAEAAAAAAAVLVVYTSPTLHGKVAPRFVTVVVVPNCNAVKDAVPISAAGFGGDDGDDEATISQSVLMTSPLCMAKRLRDGSVIFSDAL